MVIIHYHAAENVKEIKWDISLILIITSFFFSLQIHTTQRHSIYSQNLLKDMGVLDHISDMFDCSSAHSINKRHRQLQTVEIKVKMDCEGCERKVRRSVEGMKGVSSVTIEPKQHKLTVVGYLDPEKVVSRVAHRTGKKAEIWPYVPYDVVAHPYAQGIYDKKAPAGYVRRDDYQSNQLARVSSTEVRYTTAFSDENPAACVVM
ncbi:heavy metal-associated isoprenylated plant protein 26-like [Solanum dulcamara]|uniref:heavy metal-associated isoprenylated plant protein 26-like n=1 Tax=Solanum dulcamara TaxID=45834 RepID=UPI002485BFB4|nr:heavy metal-associated isoprenylated plant protein 26-like [Solanum dulcamara]